MDLTIQPLITNCQAHNKSQTGLPIITEPIHPGNKTFMDQMPHQAHTMAEVKVILTATVQVTLNHPLLTRTATMAPQLM